MSWATDAERVAYEERQRALDEKPPPMTFDDPRGSLHGDKAMIRRLREALDRAGTRLAQVQPAIDPACTWALDIVPQAEREIADALEFKEQPFRCYDHDCRKHRWNDPECNHAADGCTVMMEETDLDRESVAWHQTRNREQDALP